MSKKTSVQTIVNVGGGALVLLLGGYAALSHFYLDAEPIGCMHGYERVARLDLHTEQGQPVSMIELQARAGYGEQGLMENAKIVTVEGAPAPTALEVALGRADTSDATSAIGVHFAWRPVGISRAGSACMRYSVFMPDGFDFSWSGALPGFFGGAEVGRDEVKDEKSFALRTRWSRNGSGQILGQSKVIDATGQKLISREGRVKLARGRWVTLDQELVLNSAGKADGEVRVWVDGTKVMDVKNVQFREDETIGIEGAVATVGFLPPARDVPTGEAAKVRITPIEFGWR